ncbi:MAG: serine hydrolase domain-containing protein [Bacillota bacterium]|nr:serine hydrolase domain-containing protein [Bacillota bacterium]
MNFKKLEDFLNYITQWRIPGCDMAVYYKGGIVFRHMSGYRDKENKIPMDGSELFNIYSASKVITCATALTLLEQGKFLLTDPLYEYIPEFKDVMVKRGKELIKPERPIEIRHLFSMSAGLDYDINMPSILEVKEKTKGRCPTLETVKAMAKKSLLFEPGAHWNYSLCHDVLGGLIEVISGKTFGEYLNEAILEPLNMKNTGFGVNDEIFNRMAKQYRFIDEKNDTELIPAQNVVYRLGTEYESGGAGLYSSVEDYMKFASSLACYGKYGNTQVLSRAAIDLMRENQLDEQGLRDFIWPQLTGYGYGLGVRTMMDRSKGALSPIGEFGWCGAAGCYVLIDPLNNLAVFYAQHLLNNQEAFVHPRLRNIVYACLDAE